MSNKPEIMYQSKGCTPAGDPFMTVKKARGYYEYAERGGKNSIAFILYDSKENKYGIIYESKPPLDETFNTEVKMHSAFGGSIDMDIDTTYQEICQTEVAEEAGYEVPLENIYSVGETLVSTQMSQLCSLYLVDVTGIPKTLEAEYEKEIDSDQADKDENEFVGNRVDWFSAEEIMEIGEWKSIYIVARSTF